MNGVPVLDLAACRIRQERLGRIMAERSLDAVVVVTPEHVQYLTGHRWDFRFSPAAAIAASGKAVLVCPDRPVEQAAADEIRTYEAKWRSTLRTDQREASSAVLGGWLSALGRIRRVGVEYSACPPHVTRLLAGAELVDIEPDLLRLRRRKDPDELASLRRAIDASAAMFRAAREIIRPGITELEVFSSLQAAAVTACGEMLTGTGNDYACGVRGGPPRNVCEALRIVERMARPGVRCRDLYEAVREWLSAAPVGGWSSHLGHGIGLFVHEGPHLNPHWDDVLEAGDVIAVEPALYGPELASGLRIENDYLVTADGVELLSHIPLELAG